MGFYVWSLFCCAVLNVISSFAIISLGERKLSTLLLMPCVTVGILCPFLAVPWVCLQCVIVVFPGHAHFFLGIY